VFDEAAEPPPGWHLYADEKGLSRLQRADVRPLHNKMVKCLSAERGLTVEEVTKRAGLRPGSLSPLVKVLGRTQAQEFLRYACRGGRRCGGRSRL